MSSRYTERPLVASIAAKSYIQPSHEIASLYNQIITPKNTSEMALASALRELTCSLIICKTYIDRATLNVELQFMITSNIYHRIFRICLGYDTGTAFAIEVDNKQYLVTAKHLIPKGKNVDYIEIDYDNSFRKMPCRLVGYGKGDCDIVVLSLCQQIAPILRAEPSRADMIYSQEVYFLGFPYNMSLILEGARGRYPLPLVKRAIVSGSENGKYGAIYLDGFNNPGFSGGPVVFKPHNGSDLKICAVVSGYKTEDIEAMKGIDEDKTDLIVRLNTGIILSYPIESAVDTIHENPIGVEI